MRDVNRIADAAADVMSEWFSRCEDDGECAVLLDLLFGQLSNAAKARSDAISASSSAGYQPPSSWRFEIVFDERRADCNGYALDDLYECVGMAAEARGMKRAALGTWNAASGYEVESQLSTLLALARTDWVRANAVSLTAYEGDGVPIDCLAL